MSKLNNNGLQIVWNKMKSYINNRLSSLGDVSTEDIVPIVKGGTNATTAGTARTNLGITYGTTEPSGTPDTGEGSVYFRTGGDAVVEVGTDGIWTYRKYASGISECWGIQAATLSHYTTWNGMYGYYTSVNVPSGLFNSSPVVSFTCQVGSGFSLGGTVRSGSATITCYSISSASDSQSTYWYIRAVGRWK